MDGGIWIRKHDKEDGQFRYLDLSFLPNVKDEPRAAHGRQTLSNYGTCGAKNRWTKSQGQSARWLWRLVRRIGQMPDVREGKDEAPEEQRVKAREGTDATAGRNEHRATRDATRLTRPPYPKTATDPRIRRILCVQRRRRH